VWWLTTATLKTNRLLYDLADVEWLLQTISMSRGTRHRSSPSVDITCREKKLSAMRPNVASSNLLFLTAALSNTEPKSIVSLLVLRLFILRSAGRSCPSSIATFMEEGFDVATVWAAELKSAEDLECASVSSSVVLASNFEGDFHDVGIDSSSLDRVLFLLEGLIFRLRIVMPRRWRSFRPWFKVSVCPLQVQV